MNILFLNPSFLWMLPLALGPLVFHLWFRKRERRVEFSDLRFVRQALERVQTGLRVRRYLLLTVRMLIVAALVAFFARPVWQSGQPAAAGGKDRPPAVVLLIDASYSSGYRERGKSRLDAHREAAHGILSLLPARSRAGIVVYSDRVESATPILSNDLAQLRRLIDGVTVTSRPTDFSAAWNAAEGLLAQAPGSRHTVIILSDLAGHGFRSRIETGGAGRTVIVFDPERGENLSIADVTVVADPAGAGISLETTYRVEHRSPPPSWAIEYYLDNRKAGSDLLKLPGSRTGNHRFHYPGTEEQLWGRAELGPDDLNVDNAFYWAVSRQEPCRTWIIDGDPESGGVTAESFYLRTAFPRAVTVTERELDGIDLTVPGTVFLANLRSDHPAIERFVRAGGGACVFLGDNYSDGFDPAWLPALPASRFERQLSVSWAAGAHPLADRFPASGFEWERISVEQGFALQPADGAQVLAALSSGWPFLVERPYGAGRVVLCASSADREWNNLAGKPVFVPFLHALARYLSLPPSSGDRSAFSVGDTVRRAWQPGMEFVTPSGRRVKPRQNGRDALFSGTEEPGIYRIAVPGRADERFAVNLDARSGESDLAPPASGELKKIFTGGTLVILPRDRWEKALLSALSGIDVSRHVMGILSLLVLAEILLANPIQRARSGAKGTAA